MAITSSSEHVRRDARRCLLTFLLNYPHQRRFLNTHTGHLLRQLELPSEASRLSVATLLAALISELPSARLLLQMQLDETLLLATAAAIERETSPQVRLTLYGLVRLLFTRLPEDRAQRHSNEYLLAFLRAPADTRASARLLGLQVSCHS